MEFKYIVTHSGGAHRDEILAISIALAHAKLWVPVYRRDPTTEELEDEKVLVLDVGGRHEPERLNFDHHQLPRDAEPECALSLLVKYLGLEDQFKLQPWWDTTVRLDSKGPMATAKALGLTELPEALWSPIESMLTVMFSQSSMFGWEVHRGAYGDAEAINPLVEMLRELGRHLLETVAAYAKVYDAVSSKVVEVGSLQGILWAEPQTSVMTDAANAYRSRSGRDIAFSIMLSDREGESWCLYRFDDHQKVDFSRLEGHERVVFAHKGGFIAKLVPGVSEDEALELLQLAVLP